MKHHFLKAIPFFLLISCNQHKDFDLLILNGQIHDGNNSTVYQANLGVKSDTIHYIGQSSDFTAYQVIDAEGYIVSPGFIDPHTHAIRDLNDSIRKSNLNYLHQGVTTVFIGSDGRNTIDIGGQIEKFEDQGIGTNVVLFAGHNSIRRRIMGMRDDAPIEEELNQMKSLVDKAMSDGAIGLSSGLYYAPGVYSTTEEVIALAKVAAQYDGVYDAHIRDESTYNIGLIEAVNEMITIAGEANIPVNFAHIKCLGVDVWNQSDSVIQLIEKAKENGLKISADQYPYEASGTSIVGALVPRWVLAEDPDPNPKFSDPDLRPRIISDMKENLRKRGGADRLLLTAAKADSLVGRTLAEIAKDWNMTPVETAIKIQEMGGSSLASFNMEDSDIQNFMKQPWVMTSSDGSTGHPRKYGSFPKKIKEYVLNKNTLSLPEMIHKSTGLTAKTFKLKKRGLIQEGYFADIIIFKPEEVKDLADFKNPIQYAEGMEYVILNGEIAIHEGRYQNILAGKVLKR